MTVSTLLQHATLNKADHFGTYGTPRGAWATATDYAKNDIVTYQGGTYRALLSFTSGATFKASNWELLSTSDLRRSMSVRRGSAKAYASRSPLLTRDSSRNLALIEAPTNFTIINPALVRTDDGTAIVCLYRVASSTGIITTAGFKGEVYAKRFDIATETWGDAYLVRAQANKDLRDQAATLLADGRIAMTEGNETSATSRTGEIVFSTDGGLTFGGAAGAYNITTTYDWSVAPTRVCQLPNGDLLQGLTVGMTADTYFSAVVVRSTDGGATWGSQVLIANGPADSIIYSEPQVTILPNGKVGCYVRGEDGVMYLSTSPDQGTTWGPLASVLTAVRNRPMVRTLASGNQVVITRGHTGSPLDFAAVWAASTDPAGLVWSGPYRLDDDGSTGIKSYGGDCIEVYPGVILSVYCAHTGTGIYGETTGLYADWLFEQPLLPSTSKVLVRKRTTETVTSSATLQDDDDLAAVLAPGTYAVTGWLEVDGATTGDIKLGWTAPSDASGSLLFSGQANTASASFGSVATTTAAKDGSATRGTLGGTHQLIQVSGWVTIVTAGWFKLRWAQGTSDAGATTVYAGSWLRFEAIP